MGSKYRREAVYITGPQFIDDILCNYGDAIGKIVAYFNCSEYEDRERNLWVIPLKSPEIQYCRLGYIDCMRVYYEDLYPNVEILIIDWQEKTLLDLPIEED